MTVDGALAAGEEKTLTITGSAKMITTAIDDGSDVTSTLQGTDSNITVTYHMTAKETNSIFNNESSEIRLYNTAGAVGSKITFRTNPGYSFKEVTVTWGNKNNGNCNYTSGVKNAIGGCAFNVENVGNTSGTRNGQVKISSIVVTYFAY